MLSDRVSQKAVTWSERKGVRINVQTLGMTPLGFQPNWLKPPRSLFLPAQVGGRSDGSPREDRGRELRAKFLPSL